MTLWFVTLAVLGIPHIVHTQEILLALSPTYALAFVLEHPLIAFVTMGGVVLAITGAEALYAEMGLRCPRHPPALVPAGLTGSDHQLPLPARPDPRRPRQRGQPLFRLAPSWATLPLLVLATLATVIASQAVISGAYSVSRQAVRLGILPRMLVKHTSRQEAGQIYVPVINWVFPYRPAMPGLPG